MKVRTSAFRRLAILSLSALAFAACDDKDPVITPVERPDAIVSITPSSATLTVGQTVTFVGSVQNDSTGSFAGVTYSSSNTAVATVNATTGVVTAVAPGTSTIIATSKGFPSKSAAAQVTVNPVVVTPITIAVAPSTATVNVGGTVQLVSVVSGTTNQTVNYTTSDASVATVSAAGVVTANATKNGTAVITATSAANPAATAQSIITVTGAPGPQVVAITINPPAATIEAGGTFTFVANVTGSTNTAKTFTSSDPTVATVNATTGVVTALNKAGSTVITATASADPTKTASATLTVTRPAVTVTVSPTTVALAPQGTATITSTLTGSASDIAAGVTCSSADQAIATVTSPGCVVTAVATGTTTITVTSVADPTKTALVTVNVSAVQQPSISIQSVTNAGVAVAPNTATAGTITVVVNVSAGSQTNIQRVAVRLTGPNGAVEVCPQTFSPPLAPTQGVAQITCVINTAGTNADGTPIFINGTYLLEAVAFSAATGNPEVAKATYGNITFANPNVTALTITTVGVSSSGTSIGGPTSDAPGLLWNEGDVVVTVTPTMFAGGNVSSAQACLNFAGVTANSGAIAGPICRTSNAAVGNVFTITFPKASAATAAADGVAGVEATAVSATVTTVTAAGANGPGSTSGSIRLDNRRPSVTAFGMAPNAYINDDFDFQTDGGFTMTDLGGDAATVVFNVVTTSGAAVAGGQDVDNASGVAETTTSTQYVLQAVVTDNLGNTQTVYAGPAGAAVTTVAAAARFGVDRTAPTITVTGPANGSTNSTNTYNFSFSDAGTGPSGFGATPLAIRVEQFTPNGSGGVTRACIDPLTGAQLAGAGNGCTVNGGFVNVADAATDVILPTGATNAYFQVTGNVTDFAGNQSANVSRVTLNDDVVAPTIGFIVGPTQINGGQSVTFNAQMSDDVELGDQLGYIGYQENAVNLYITSPRTTLGAYGFDVLSTPLNSSFTVDQFIRSVETTAAAVPSTVISRATDANLAVRDIAGLQLDGDCPAPGAPGSTSSAAEGGCTTAQTNILGAISLGMNAQPETSFGAANRPFGAVTGTNPNGGGTGFNNTTTVAPVCSNIPVGGNAACNVNPTTKTLSATATGPAQTFANPFERVNFYYVDAQGRSIFIGTGSVSVTDNTVTSTRTWTYSTTWNPGAMGVVAAAGYPVYALGIDAQGRALKTADVAVPVTSD